MVEPELPQSSGSFDGVTRPATPVISTEPSSMLFDLCAQRLHAGQGRGAVGAGGEVGEARSALGKGAQHAVAVADGLVAGQAQAAQTLRAGRMMRSCVAVCKGAPGWLAILSSLSNRAGEAFGAGVQRKAVRATCLAGMTHCRLSL